MTRANKLALALLLIASLSINTMGLGWALPNTNAWHGDDMCHYTLHAIANRFSGFTKYPIVQHLVLAIAYSPYLLGLYLRGELDTHAGSLEEAFESPIESMTVLILITRVIGILMGTGTVWLLYRIVNRLSHHWPSAIVAGAVYAFSNETVFLSKMLLVDTSMMFWFALSFHAYLVFAERLDPRSGFVLGVLTAVSVSTKEQIAGTYVLIAAVLFAIYFWRRRTSAPPLRGFVWAAAATLVTYAILSKIVVDPLGWSTRMKMWLGEGTDPRLWGGVPNTFRGHLELLATTVQKLEQSMGMPLLLFSGGALCFALLRCTRRACYVALPLLSYYVFTLGMIRYVNTRFLLPIIFLLAAMCGVAMAHPFFRRHKTKTIALVGLSLLFAWSMQRCLKTNALMYEDARYRAEAFLVDRLPPEATIEVYADDHYLPRIEYLGFVREAQRERMQIEQFLARKPAAVVLAPDSWWKVERDQQKFLKWLRLDSGYEVHFFDRSPESSYLAHEDLTAMQTQLFVLLRRQQ